MKTKVKIIKASASAYNYNYDNYDYDDYRQVFSPASGDWEEIEHDELPAFKEAIKFANLHKTDNSYYFLVQYDEGCKEEVFATASAFRKEQEKQKERIEKKKAEDKIKKEARSKERKLKQLEKLKRELGEKE